MKLYKNTVSPILWNTLIHLMRLPSLDSFRLVGGTALSLQIGHRMSIDIDLFTDLPYGSVDFESILEEIKSHYRVVEHSEWSNKAIGNSCYLGSTQEQLIKLDLFYTDPFVFEVIRHDNLRMASKAEIAAMKLEVITRGGRKKDYWDIHALLEYYSLQDLFNAYLQRFPYEESALKIVSQLNNFAYADSDPDPRCLQGKYWELIKLDLEEARNKL